MKLNLIAYITIALLICVILLQNKCSSPTPPKETRDTVVVYKTIHDTILGEIVYLKGKTVKDTVWLTSEENKPDSTYEGLLKQYNFLGNKYYEKRVFKTDFPIADYGSVTVYDTIKANSLIGSSIITDLNIPITTITVTKEAPIKRQLYVGFSLTGNSPAPINGVYVDVIFRTKKDRLYGVSMGYNGEPIYKISLLWPLKIK